MARKGTKSKSFTYEGQRYWAYGKTPEEAEANAKVKKALLEHNVKKYTNTITVRDWAYEWLEKYKKGSVSNDWYKCMESNIRLRIVPAIGTMQLRNVKAADISKLYNAYADASYTAGNNLVQIIRQIFNTAEQNDLIAKSPARGVKPPKFKSKKHYRILTQYERELFFKAAEKHPDDGLFFYIAYFCGLRPQEIAALQYGDYDKVNRTLTVQRARKTDNSIGITKTDSGVRVIPVPDKLAVILDKLDRKPRDLVVTAPKGGMYTRSAQSKLWRRFKTYMEIEGGARVEKGVVLEPILSDDLYIYSWRHTYCTNLQDMGVPVTEARYLMGHKSATLTANIYTHHSEESFADAREKMNKYHKDKTAVKSKKLKKFKIKK